jgi:hypothetical protein
MLVDDVLAPEVSGDQSKSFEHDAAVLTARVKCFLFGDLLDRKPQKVNRGGAARAIRPPDSASHVGGCHTALVRPLICSAAITVQPPAQIGCLADIDTLALLEHDFDHVDTGLRGRSREGGSRS